MSASSYKKRKAHRELGRQVKDGKADEASAAAWKATEDKRQAKITAKAKK